MKRKFLQSIYLLLNLSFLFKDNTLNARTTLITRKGNFGEMYLVKMSRYFEIKDTFMSVMLNYLLKLSDISRHKYTSRQEDTCRKSLRSKLLSKCFDRLQRMLVPRIDIK